MSNFADTIERFATGTYTVTRRAKPSYTEGRLDPPATPTTFTVKASVYPVSGRDLERRPEGRKTKEAKAVITATELRIKTETEEPDVISIGGESYQVEKVEPWELGSFYRAIVTKV